jgi:hypothetical protein
MRVLLTIPHYYDRRNGDSRHGATSDDASFRQAALESCIASLHQSLGRAQSMMQLRNRRTDTANADLTALVHVVICTTADRHLVSELTLEQDLYQHRVVAGPPEQLGFQARRILRDRFGSYDWYGYLEDDLLLHDPWFLQKLIWFQELAGPEAVLLPNRFERGRRSLVTRAYVDGDLEECVTREFQDIHDQPTLSATALGRPVTFRRPLNPHSGCYFLSAEQLSAWMTRPEFLSTDAGFVGPLESAATLALMQCFRIYKPDRACASFLEIEHAGDRFIRQLRRPEATDRT